MDSAIRAVMRNDGARGVAMAYLEGLSLATIVWTLVVIAVVTLVVQSIRYIPNTRVGILEKRISVRGSIESGLIALGGEAGFQPAVLRGGWHFFLPFVYRIHTVPLVTIAQGKIGYVFARDGRPLRPDQALAENTKAIDFQDVRRFLDAGGQRGPQRQILREGTYAINLAQFVVLTEAQLYYLALDDGENALFQSMARALTERDGFRPIVIKGSDDVLGIVTVQDGPSLAQGEIIAPTVGDDPNDARTFHNNFQDPERFLAAGGRRGRQLHVLVEGTYYVNRVFATVEIVPKTIVEIGNVGVVISYTGGKGDDLSGSEYTHGEMVEQGKRGVWSVPLLPGKYAFNTFAGQIVMVPTTNIILKWIRNQSGAHKLDENLAEVSLITKDAFEPSLPLSVVIHIDYRKAPLVIQRFGDIKRLVEQTLDPMVSAYFKNVGQTRTLIQLIQERAHIQQVSGEEMKTKFGLYSLELQEVLIGTPNSAGGDKNIEAILKQLRDRQIAAEQIDTYERQEKAAVKERELREAEARARQQQTITESELSITVQGNQGKAEYQRSVQQAAQIRALAEAESDKVRMIADGEASRIRALGQAEADKTARIGIAQALAIDEQVRAYGGPKFQLTQQVMTRFAEAIEAARIDVVPRILIGGSGGNGGTGPQGSLLEALLALMLSDRMGDQVMTDKQRDPTATALRDELRKAVTTPGGTARTNGDPRPS
jgi:uncharacterized membrane protein YqiK